MSYRTVAVEGVDGGGKSTLVDGLEKKLSESRKVIRARPSRATVNAFRRIAEQDCPGVLYHDVFPGDLRNAAYVLEAAVQFRYEQRRYEEADVVLFDRWWQTWDVYCAEISEHQDWMRRIAATLPSADVLFWVRVDPELALRRLVARRDPWVDVYSPDRLRARIDALCAGYQRVMEDAGAVVLDGSEPAEQVLAGALRALEGHVEGPGGASVAQ